MSSSKRQPFHFVFTNPATEKERKRESQLARSHTARVNREKRLPVRQPWKASTAAQPKKIVQRAHTYPTPASSETASSGRDERENENTSWDGSQARHNKSWKGSTASTSSAVLNDDSQSWALVLSPRTISPVFGAQSTETFALGASLADTARAANYCKSLLLSFVLYLTLPCSPQCTLAQFDHGQSRGRCLVYGFPRAASYLPWVSFRSYCTPRPLVQQDLMVGISYGVDAQDEDDQVAERDVDELER